MLSWTMAGLLLAHAPSITPPPDSVSCTIETGGIERCRHALQDLPRFFQLLRLRHPALSSMDPGRLPFGRSVAVLVGVSQYTTLKELGFVRNDLENMKDYLLGPGGFDETFVLRDDDVKTSVVEDLMLRQLPDQLGSEDRLLFYFSGHGFDYGGATGYLAFASAKPSVFQAEAMIPVGRIVEWSTVIRARHTLFLLDSCSSGLGSDGVAKAIEARPLSAQVLDSLSKNGSRVVITAGTAEEEAIGSPEGSLFTSVLLRLLRGEAPTNTYSGLMSAHTLFGSLYERVIVEAQPHGKMTPRARNLPGPDLRGVFLFLSAEPSPPMSRDVMNGLGGTTKDEPAFPRPTRWQDLALSLGTQRVSGPEVLLDLGVTPPGPQSVSLAVENRSGEEVEISVRPDGSGLQPEFPGGAWSARLAGHGHVLLQVTVEPEFLTAESRLVILGGDDELVRLRPRASVADPQKTVSASSGPQPSGAGGAFSPLYSVCVQAPEPTFRLERGSDKFNLTGDRACGAWAECERSVEESSRVCWGFRLQGHNELLHDQLGVRTSEGHLTAVFRSEPTPPKLLAAGRTP